MNTLKIEDRVCMVSHSSLISGSRVGISVYQIEFIFHLTGDSIIHQLNLCLVCEKDVASFHISVKTQILLHYISLKKFITILSKLTGAPLLTLKIASIEPFSKLVLKILFPFQYLFQQITKSKITMLSKYTNHQSWALLIKVLIINNQ
jgi:hypothetical protein